MSPSARKVHVHLQLSLAFLILLVGLGVSSFLEGSERRRNSPSEIERRDDARNLEIFRSRKHSEPGTETSDNNNPSIHFTATPDTVNEGVTDVLELKCEYVGFKSLLSIAIGKRQKGNIEGLAYLASGKPGTMDPDCLGDVTGGLDEDGHGGYLNFKVRGPSKQDGGRYECLVGTMEEFGQIKTSRVSVNVKTEVEAMTEQTHIQRFLKTEALVKSLKNELFRLRSDLKTTGQTPAYLSPGQGKIVASNLHTLLFTASTEFKNRTYLLSQFSTKTYLKADECCEAVGGYLAEIDDRDEYEFLSSFLADYVNSGTVLLGGTDRWEEGTWMFDRTQKPVTFFSWTTPAPEHKANDEKYDCLAMLLSGNHHIRMGRILCNSPPRGYHWDWFVCEIPHPTSETE